MKRFCVFLIALGITIFSFAQNNTLRGLVKLQSSGAKPLAGVQISAFGAGTVYSNSSGMFELTFNGKKPGASVSLLVQIDGYELINDKELERCVLPNNPDDLIFVVLAKQGERNKQALVYYNIIIGNANTNYSKELRTIRNRLDALDEDDTDRRVLREQIASLQEEKEALINQAEELAKQLATVDLDRASGLAGEAYQKFKAGDIKAAIAILDDEALDKNLKEAQAKKNNLQERLVQADSAVQQSIENYMIKARFCISDRQYTAAYKNYLKAVEADSTNLDNIWELADYCDILNQQKRAIRFYQQAFDITTSASSKAAILQQLGQQFQYDNNFAKAEAFFLQSLQLYQRLYEEDPQSYELLLSVGHRNLGSMYYTSNDYPKAADAFSKSYEIIKGLAAKYQSSYEPELAHTLYALANLSYSLRDYSKAKEYYIQALEIFKRLSIDDPAKYEPSIAKTQGSLGVLYNILQQPENAEEAYLETVEIERELARENPQRYEPALSITLMNFGIFYSDLNDLSKSEKVYLESIAIRKRLVKENPRRYEPDLAKGLGNLGNLYYQQKQYTKAETVILESIEIYRGLALENKQVYEPDLAFNLGNLGFFYESIKNYSKADTAYFESLKIYENLARKNPKRYNPDLGYTQIGIAYLMQSLLLQELDLNYQEKGLELAQNAKVVLNACDTSISFVQDLLKNANELEGYFLDFSAEDLEIQKAINNCLPYQERNAIEKDPSAKIINQEKVVAILEGALNNFPQDSTLQALGLRAYNNLARFALSGRQFKKAEEASLKGLEINPKEEWQNVNLALALLYQGKFKQAKKLMLKIKHLSYNGSTLKSALLDDLDALEKEGITHKDVEKARALLKE